MPWNSDYFPISMKHLPPRVREKAIEIASRHRKTAGRRDLTQFEPSTIAFLAWTTWHDAPVGHWPDIPRAERNPYDIGAIKRWLGVFIRRFFNEAQLPAQRPEGGLGRIAVAPHRLSRAQRCGSDGLAGGARSCARRGYA